MTYQKIGGSIIAKDIGQIGDIDGVIFDCDGVLVDVSKSYDLAIRKTTQYVLKKFANIKSIPITAEIISGFKSTGGFNDEVDVTYASILSLVAAKKLGIDDTKFIFRVIKNADSTGVRSVEKFLDTLDVDLSDMRKKLDYPGKRTTNPLYEIFDQIFYGPTLYKKIFKKKSQFTEKGLINNDKVILTKKLLSVLEKKFGSNLAIVSGRGKESVRYSLKELLNGFNLKSSLFLEDEPREMAKPNPKSLLFSVSKLHARHCLYVGDSMEDLIMAKKVAKMGKKITFCGIYGTSKNPDSKIHLFKDVGVPVMIKSINLIPKALNLAK
ncbi:HAD family hydrolase [Candidatus Nitrosotenuis sp. DW1]|uniref:HAD family hydrolase n=1 Tax=Candidatus Nitrosotenuis sp. DW1 TaxID=2259672 RepID=UPI0015C928D4|nr:HAD-IA family hydrolase [Candidatus Nitrosotenuis sp. DW1]QLH08317.1 phosphatase [Candidatus Nitrosotenuis sp. DW1]